MVLGSSMRVCGATWHCGYCKMVFGLGTQDARRSAEAHHVRVEIHGAQVTIGGPSNAPLWKFPTAVGTPRFRRLPRFPALQLGGNLDDLVGLLPSHGGLLVDGDNRVL